MLLRVLGRKPHGRRSALHQHIAIEEPEQFAVLDIPQVYRKVALCGAHRNGGCSGVCSYEDACRNDVACCGPSAIGNSVGLVRLVLEVLQLDPQFPGAGRIEGVALREPPALQIANRSSVGGNGAAIILLAVSEIAEGHQKRNRLLASRSGGLCGQIGRPAKVSGDKRSGQTQQK